MPGCAAHAEFRAPKDRGLSGYYTFCLEHVQDYNKAWNYFSGMAQSDIEDYIVRSTLGDRPTWRYDNFAGMEHILRGRAYEFGQFGDKASTGPQEEEYEMPFARNTPEHEAMAIMGLKPPLTLEKVKTRYKELAKKYHPDVNKNDQQSEELLKSVNMAYTILKLAYQKYEKLDER
ncbi:MAG: J domain-containing protein [Rhodospirillales bacterium]|nr:J domain-containing protein [Rhodospirillales bacterium]MCB9995902.1 J domain-containing protein [Rhodospirillales bacterium]